MQNQEMIHWWQGYVVIQIRGKKLERLINHMMHQRFSAWNIVRSSDNEALLAISLTDFFKLRPLLKETGCRLHVLERKGLPFLLKKMRLRVGLALGVVIFCLLLYTFSSMIWSVHIVGVANPENRQMLEMKLREIGVRPGTFKFLVDNPSTIKNKVMEAIPEVTWVGFHFQGTQAILKVVEKTVPQIPVPTSPRHLVAKKKAIVYDLFVEQGQPKVKPNQYVRPGDLLVSGYIGEGEGTRLVSAKGKVWGEVWYEAQIVYPLTREQNIYTGEEKRRYYLSFGSFPVQVWGFGSIPFQDYNKQQLDYQLSIKDFTFPVHFVAEQLQATDKQMQTLSEEQAIKAAKEQGRIELLGRLPKNVEIKAENVLRKHVENGKVYIKMHYTVIEEIASEQIIIQGD